QLFRRSGTGQETFGAELQREAFVLRVVVPARIENERNALQAIVLLAFAAQGEAVHARQDDIGDDGLRRLAARGIQRRQAVGGLQYPMTMARQQSLERGLLG